MTLSHVLAARCALMSLPLLVAGCSTGNTPAPASSPSSSTTAMATTDAVEQDAVDQAVALVPTYWQTLDGLFADPALPIDSLYQVAVDPEATSEAAAIQTFRSNGYLQSGTSRVVSTTVGAVDLETGAAGDFPSVSVSACIDVAQVGAIDASGMSVAAADRAPYLISELTIVNIDYPDASSWRVSSAPNTQAQACPD